MVAGLKNINCELNWDNRLRLATDGTNSITCKYAPDGPMVSKVTTGTGAANYKYVVDRIGEIPTVLLVLDENNNKNIVKSFYHALGQTIAQRDASDPSKKYYYLHDRLGSVRELVYLDSTDVKVKNRYTYDPFGGPLTAETEDPDNFNPYRFAGYAWDGTIKQYYCNARWYDPALARFTGRDPVFGDFKEPLTLHAYLYCMNDPVNGIDPSGKMTLAGQIVAGSIVGGILGTVQPIIKYYSGQATLKDIVAGGIGGMAAGGFGAWLGTTGFIAKLATESILGSAAAGGIVGSSASGVNTLTQHMVKWDWRIEPLLADMLGSMVVGSVTGGLAGTFAYHTAALDVSKYGISPRQFIETVEKNTKLYSTVIGVLGKWVWQDLKEAYDLSQQ
jgi:RHS repeat-associated protein